MLCMKFMNTDGLKKSCAEAAVGCGACVRILLTIQTALLPDLNEEDCLFR